MVHAGNRRGWLPRLCGGSRRPHRGGVPHVSEDAVGSETAFVVAGGDRCCPDTECHGVVGCRRSVGGVALNDDVDVAVRLGRFGQVGVECRDRVTGRRRRVHRARWHVEWDHHRLDVRRAGVVVLVRDVQRHRHVREVHVVGAAVDLRLEVACH